MVEPSTWALHQSNSRESSELGKQRIFTKGFRNICMDVERVRNEDVISYGEMVLGEKVRVRE